MNSDKLTRVLNLIDQLITEEEARDIELKKESLKNGKTLTGQSFMLFHLKSLKELVKNDY